jgi:hypothetical protein
MSPKIEVNYNKEMFLKQNKLTTWGIFIGTTMNEVFFWDMT